MSIPSLRPVQRAGALALLLPVLLLAGCRHAEAPVAAVRPAMVVQPAPAGAEHQVFPGEVRARYEPALAFRVGGKIVRRTKDAGDRVQKGEVLAELDPQDLRLQADAARAMVGAAEADLELARSERDRHRALLERKLISQSQFDARENQFRAAEARFGQAKAQHDVASNQAAYAFLRATDDGVIAQRLGEAGQVVAPGQTVYVLAADGDREIAISLPENGVEQIKVGQPALVTLWSKPDQKIPGKVREIAPAADASARTFAARIEIAAEVGDIDLGQSARVIFSNAGHGALAVPLSAVIADGGRNFVWTVDPKTSTVQRREVQIGPFGDATIPVLEGIAAGEWIVAAGVHLLREGQAVRPVDRDNRPVALTPAG